MKTLLTTIIAFMSLTLLAQYANNQPVVCPQRPRTNQNNAKATNAVLVKIVKINPGMSTRSLPPQTNCTIEVEVIKVINGENPGTTIRYRYVGTDIGFKKGDIVLFTGITQGKQIYFNKAATGDKIDSELKKIEKK